MQNREGRHRLTLRLGLGLLVALLLIVAVGFAVASSTADGTPAIDNIALAAYRSHPYPSGTPTLTLNASSTALLAGQELELSCQSTASSMTIHCYDLFGCYDIGTYTDDDQPGVFFAGDRSHAATFTYWAEDSDGNFSNKVTVQWTSIGQLAAPANLRINGTPVAQWTDDFIAYVPYTVTWDAVPNATEYMLDLKSSSGYLFSYYMGNPTSSPTLTVILSDPAEDVFLRVSAFAENYDDVQTITPALCDVVQKTPTLTLNASPAAAAKTITFTCQSSATDVWLCYTPKDDYPFTPLRMEKNNGEFTAAVDSSFYNDYPTMDFWAADSSFAVSKIVSVDWTAGSPTLTTLTLPASLKTIQADALRGVAAQEIIVPNGCETIGAHAFQDCFNLLGISIPASVTSIDATAFEGCFGFTVYGKAGSVAETFAKTNGITFVAK